MFSIPIIVLSTVTGTASVAMTGYVPESYITYAQLAVGGVNIFTGILSTLQNFFRSAQCSESHYNANVGWDKLCRNIEIELTLERNRRKNANDFVKICRIDETKCGIKGKYFKEEKNIDFKIWKHSISNLPSKLLNPLWVFTISTVFLQIYFILKK